MTELTPRQKLLEEITEKLDFAIQSDLENGVKSLNEKAAIDFHEKYPELNKVLMWIHDLHFQEMPDDY